jgi:hypothetical protein
MQMKLFDSRMYGKATLTSSDTWRLALCAEASWCIEEFSISELPKWWQAIIIFTFDHPTQGLFLVSK